MPLKIKFLDEINMNFQEVKQGRKNNRGVAALTTIIIISAIGLTIGITLSNLSLNELILSFEDGESQRALFYAEGCAEEGAYRLKLNTAYAGGTVTYGTYSCTVSVSGSGSTRTVTADATYKDFTRTVSYDVSFVQNTAGNAHGRDITHWQE